MDQELENRLRAMLDRHEIWLLVQRYGRGLDRLDRELVRSIYFDDAVEDHGSYVGTPDDFLDWADRGTESFLITHHNVMNHHCELDGDDAHSETYYLFIGVAPQPPHLLSMGRYLDHCQRRNGEWRIANRICLIEKNFQLLDDEIWSRIPAPDYEGEAPAAARDRRDASYQRPLRPRPLPASK